MTSYPTARDLLDRRDQINRELKATVQVELRTVLYAYNEQHFIVCSTTGISEAGEPAVLTFDVGDQELGAVVLSKLLETYVFPKPAYKENKLADWPAFRASGAKTGRAFEENSIYITVATVNTGLRVEARPRLQMSGIYVGIPHSVAVRPEELGSTIHTLVSTVALLGQHLVL